MAVGLLGRKVGMTQIFDPTGQVIPVTVIQAGPCHVLQLRTSRTDGYEAVQLGYLDKPRRLASRAARGHVAKLDSKRQKRRAAAGVEAAAQGRLRAAAVRPRIPRSPVERLQVGQELKVDIFAEIKAVDVIRHQQGPRHRRCDEAAQFRRPAGHARREESASPRRLDRLQYRSAPRLQGPPHGRPLRRGCVTARNLKVVPVDAENNLLLVRGAVPGPNGGYVVIRRPTR